MIGIGFDIHRLAKNRPLYIGGLKIPYEKGLIGHSDADVLLHAVCDSILGAAGLGDIGDLFPDTDPKYKDASSDKFVSDIIKRIKRKRLKVQSIDTIIFAEKPKLFKYKLKIRKSVASLLKISEKNVNIKAKTMEGLGPIGSSKAIASMALVVLNRIKNK